MIRHHQAAIREGRETAEDWPGIIAAVDALVSSGTQPSSRELRELLLPIIDGAPDRDDLPPGFHRVVREIDRFLATRPAPPSAQTAAEPAAEILSVARLLGGRSIVLIGGDRRRDSQEAIRKAFNLHAVIWIETKEHQSVYAFEPLIARPEVARAPGHSLVEPRLRRREASLRGSRQAACPAARRLWPQPVGPTNPGPVQRATSGGRRARPAARLSPMDLHASSGHD